MKFQAKGYLPRLLALLLLPVLVVSLALPDDDYDRSTNEAGSQSSSEKQRALIAEAEVAAIRARRMPEGFPATLHQQSTNAAAARRDLQYNKRTARDSKLIVGEASTLHERRFLPGQINGLSSETGDSEVYQTHTAAFLPPRIVYLDSALPQPFVRPEHKERGRVFSLTNFLTKDKRLMNPRSFGFGGGAEITENEDEKQTAEQEDIDEITDPNVSIVSTQLKMAIANGLKEETSQNFALYQSIIDEEDSALPSSFATNSVSADIGEDNLSQSASQKLQNFNVETPDYNAKSDVRNSDSRNQNVNNDEKDSKYEFGYRVIDHSAGSDYGHEEHHGSDGSATNGKYHVLLPDGRVQRVEYFADHLGYRAVVSYISQDDYENRP